VKNRYIFPRAYFEASIPPGFAPVCAGFKRRANRRFDSFEPRFHQPPLDHVAPAHGPALRAGRGEAHLGGIEGFRGYAKSRLAKFRGMSKNALSTRT